MTIEAVIDALSQETNQDRLCPKGLTDVRVVTGPFKLHSGHSHRVVVTRSGYTTIRDIREALEFAALRCPAHTTVWLQTSPHETRGFTYTDMKSVLGK